MDNDFSCFSLSLLFRTRMHNYSSGNISYSFFFRHFLILSKAVFFFDICLSRLLLYTNDFSQWNIYVIVSFPRTCFRYAFSVSQQLLWRRRYSRPGKLLNVFDHCEHVFYDSRNKEKSFIYKYALGTLL